MADLTGGPESAEADLPGAELVDKPEAFVQLEAGLEVPEFASVDRVVLLEASEPEPALVDQPVGDRPGLVAVLPCLAELLEASEPELA